MAKASGGLFGFIIKTAVLFGFIYEFVPFFMPSTFFSSRKIAFVIVFMYYFLKGYSLQPLFKDKLIRPILIIAAVCVVYSLLLMQVNSGKGELIISWYVFFLLYAVLGSFLFAGLFKWDYEQLLKALAVVTVFQAAWSICTYYIYEFRILNSVLFVIDENENIDFLSMSRLRSIGEAGASLSVFIALSSFSFLYFIMKGKAVAINIDCLVVFLFATILAGTTGMLIFTISLPLTLLLVTKGKRSGAVSAIVIVLALAFLYSKGSVLFNEDQYERLTSKYISFFQDKSENSTIQALTSEQEVSGISSQTIMGTGFSRGRVSSGEMCDHDGGYVRNYFGVGLIMAIVFYYILYRSMYKLSRRIKSPIKYLLLAYTIIMIGIEYKEPFVFYYIPIFVFLILYQAENQKQNGIIKL